MAYLVALLAVFRNVHLAEAEDVTRRATKSDGKTHPVQLSGNDGAYRIVVLVVEASRGGNTTSRIRIGDLRLQYDGALLIRVQHYKAVRLFIKIQRELLVRLSNAQLRGKKPELFGLVFLEKNNTCKTSNLGQLATRTIR